MLRVNRCRWTAHHTAISPACTDWSWCLCVAGTRVSYSTTVHNTGNVKLRTVQLAVPELSGSTSHGSIVCVDASTNGPWAAYPDLPAGGMLVCTGTYVPDQDAVESGDLHANAVLTATNLNDLTTTLPPVTVPNVPGLSVVVDTATCEKPTFAGNCLLCTDCTLQL